MLAGDETAVSVVEPGDLEMVWCFDRSIEEFEWGKGVKEVTGIGVECDSLGLVWC